MLKVHYDDIKGVLTRYLNGQLNFYRLLLTIGSYL